MITNRDQTSVVVCYLFAAPLSNLHRTPPWLGSLCFFFLLYKCSFLCYFLRFHHNSQVVTCVHHSHSGPFLFSIFFSKPLFIRPVSVSLRQIMHSVRPLAVVQNTHNDARECTMLVRIRKKNAGRSFISTDLISRHSLPVWERCKEKGEWKLEPNSCLKMWLKIRHHKCQKGGLPLPIRLTGYNSINPSNPKEQPTRAPARQPVSFPRQLHLIHWNRALSGVFPQPSNNRVIRSFQNSGITVSSVFKHSQPPHQKVDRNPLLD